MPVVTLKTDDSLNESSFDAQSKGFYISKGQLSHRRGKSYKNQSSKYNVSKDQLKLSESIDYRNIRFLSNPTEPNNRLK